MSHLRVKTRILPIVRAASGAAWVLAIGCARAPGERAPAARGAEATVAPSTEPPAYDARTPGWDLGQWYAYDFKLTTAVRFGEGVDMFDFDLDGLVQITPTKVTPQATTLYIGIAHPRIVSRVPGSQPEFDKVAAQLGSTGCFFTLSGGRVTEMLAPVGLSATAANTYRDLGAAVQFTRTVSSQDHYTAEEYDTTGQYVADYQLDREHGVWHKRKVRYAAILAAKTAPENVPARVVPQIDGSEGEIELGPDGRPMSVQQRTVIDVSGAQQPIHATTSLSLKGGAAEAAHEPRPDWNALMSAMKRTAADEPYAAQTPIESLDAARIHGMTFERALARFEQIAKEKKGAAPPSSAVPDPEEKARREKATEEESSLFIALAAILREQPASVARAVQRIRAKSPASDVLIGALSSASSSAAQSALIELAGAKTTQPALRDQILMALSRTPRPDRESINAMKALLKGDPFSEQALFGLGTYSRRLREAGSVDEANELGDLLVERLGAAQKTSDRLTALRALINAGYSPALSRVTPFLTDSQEEIRTAAVRSLQSISGPRADELIADRMRSDGSSGVRISALSAAKIREPTDVLAQAVENAATTASDPHVRFRAVEVLTAFKARRPTPNLRGALERIAKSDTEARIRDLAQSAL